ncbi:MAG: serine hydrolase [Verrucomicrobia bacterium]|nr:serine hydrolase [Verrucomicrobiota bacterium]
MKTILKLAPLLVSSQLTATQTQQLDKIASDTLSFWKVPGCAVSIVQGDEILLCKGYGVKQLDVPDSAIDIHTRFPIASITKMFTAAAIGILSDQGTLTLDTPVQKFTPLKLSDPYAASHLTLRDCLSMRSGLPGPSANPLLYSDPKITTQQLLEKILPTLPFPLGFRSHFAYQNLLYLLAATPFTPSYEAFLQKQLLAPLEMAETLTSFSSLQQCSNKALPHIWNKDRFEQIPLENLDVFLPAAGLSSTAHDMTHFLFFLLHNGVFHAKNILKPATLKEILTAQTVATTEEFTGSSFYSPVLFPTSQFLNYGLGCFIHDYRGMLMVQAPGLTDGAVSVLALVPSLNLGIFVTANAESVFFTRALLFQFIDAFLDEKTDWNTQFLKKSKEPS